ncbi:MAG: hypothetical protein CL919_07395 [Deltaproteobacteria bacterium]|nr:hypothetical protein [Deltaproteobacteria bacterium]
MSLLDTLGLSTNNSEEQLHHALEEGVHLLEHHFYDRAMVEFNQALALSHEEALASIKELFEDPQFANDVEALKSLGSNLLAKNPDDLDLANQLGNAERRQGNWQSAKRFYLHCLHHNPNVQFPAYNLAATIARTDHVDGAAVSALQPFEQAPGFILPDLEPLLPPLEELQKQVLEKEEAAAAEANDSALEPEHEQDDDAADFDAAIEETVLAKAERQLPPVEEAPDLAGSFGLDLPKLAHHIRQWPLNVRDPELMWALGIVALAEEEGRIAHWALEHVQYEDEMERDLVCFRILAQAVRRLSPRVIDVQLRYLHKHPSHRYSCVNLGVMYKKTGDLGKARVYFFRTLKLLEISKGSYHITPLLEEAVKLEEQGSVQKALEIYTPLVSEIHDPGTLVRIAKMLTTTNELEQAKTTYLRAHVLDKEDPSPLEGLKSLRSLLVHKAGVALKDGEAAKTALLLDEAISIHASDQLIEHALNVYKDLGNTKRIRELEAMRRMLDNTEKQKQVQRELEEAEKHVSDGIIEEAMHCFKLALSFIPDQQVFKRALEVCEANGRKDLAEGVTGWFRKQVEAAEINQRLEKAGVD